jgi:hypothetical protein
MSDLALILGVMMLTESQRDLLVRMIQSGEDSFVLVSTYGPRDSLLAGPGGEGKDWDISASDLRELAHQGLIRQTTEQGYELTNEGRQVYQQLISPPPEPRRVGF